MTGPLALVLVLVLWCFYSPAPIWPIAALVPACIVAGVALTAGARTRRVVSNPPPAPVARSTDQAMIAELGRIDAVLGSFERMPLGSRLDHMRWLAEKAKAADELDRILASVVEGDTLTIKIHRVRNGISAAKALAAEIDVIDEWNDETDGWDLQGLNEALRERVAYFRGVLAGNANLPPSRTKVQS